MADDFILFSGTANRSLAENIAFEVGVPLGGSIADPERAVTVFKQRRNFFLSDRKTLADVFKTSPIRLSPDNSFPMTNIKSKTDESNEREKPHHICRANLLVALSASFIYVIIRHIISIQEML